MSAKFDANTVRSVYERMAALVKDQDARFTLGIANSGLALEVQSGDFVFIWCDSSILHDSGVRLHGYVVDLKTVYAALSLFSLMPEPTAVEHDPRREDVLFTNKGLIYRIPVLQDSTLIVPPSTPMVTVSGAYMRPAFGAASFCDSAILELEDDAIVLSSLDGEKASYFRVPVQPDQTKLAEFPRRVILSRLVLAAGMIATTDIVTRKAGGDLTMGCTSRDNDEAGAGDLVLTAGNWAIHTTAVTAGEPGWPAVMPESYVSKLTVDIDEFVAAAGLVSRAAQTSEGVFEVSASGDKLRFSVISGRKRICEHEIKCVQDGAFNGRLATIPTDRVVGFVHAPSGFRRGSEMAVLKGTNSEYVLEVSGQAECLIRVA